MIVICMLGNLYRLSAMLYTDSLQCGESPQCLGTRFQFAKSMAISFHPALQIYWVLKLVHKLIRKREDLKGL